MITINNFKRSIIVLLFLSFFQTAFSQQAKYDSNKIASVMKLNLALTEKRGIKSDDIIYYVEKDKQTLTAYKAGGIKWQVNIIKICGKPVVGQPEIRYIELNKNKIEVAFGKHDFANINIQDGKTTYLGSD